MKRGKFFVAFWFAFVLVFFACKRVKEQIQEVEKGFPEVTTSVVELASSIEQDISFGIEETLRNTDVFQSQLITGRIITSRFSGLAPTLQEKSLPVSLQEKFVCPEILESRFQKCVGSGVKKVCWSENLAGDVEKIGYENCATFPCETGLINFLKGFVISCKDSSRISLKQLENCADWQGSLTEETYFDDFSGKITFYITLPDNTLVSKTCLVSALAVKNFFQDGSTSVLILAKRGEGFLGFVFEERENTKTLFSFDVTSAKAKHCKGERCFLVNMMCSPASCKSFGYVKQSTVCVNAGLGGEHYEAVCTFSDGCVFDQDERWCASATEFSATFVGGRECSADECNVSVFAKVKKDGGFGRYCEKGEENCALFALKNCQEYQGEPTFNPTDIDSDSIPDKLDLAFGEFGATCEVDVLGFESGCLTTPEGGTICYREDEGRNVLISFRECSGDFVEENINLSTECKYSYIEIRPDGTGSAQHCGLRGCVTASLYCQDASGLPFGVRPRDENGDGRIDRILVSFGKVSKSCEIRRVFVSKNLYCEPEGKCTFEKDIGMIKRTCEGDMSNYICRDEIKETGEILACEKHRAKPEDRNLEDFLKVKKGRRNYRFSQGVLEYAFDVTRGREVVVSADLQVDVCSFRSNFDAQSCTIDCDKIRSYKLVIKRVWSSSITEVFHIFQDDDIDGEWEGMVTSVRFGDGSIEVSGVRINESRKHRTVFQASLSSDGLLTITFEVFDMSGQKVAEGSLSRGEDGTLLGEVKVGDKVYVISSEGRICERGTENCREIG